MGVNIPGISRVLHVEAPTDVDDYMQQIGRGAREEDAHCVATLYYSGNGSREASKEMKEYAQNITQCRRTLLSQLLEFESAEERSEADCCDICSAMEE